MPFFTFNIKELTFVLRSLPYRLFLLALAAGMFACSNHSVSDELSHPAGAMADAAAKAMQAEEIPTNLIYGFDADRYHIIEGVFNPGDVLSKVLLPLGVGARELEELVALSKPVFDVRKIQPRQKWVSLFASDTSNVPAYFIFEKNQRDFIVFSIEDSLAVWRDSKPTEHRLRRERGVITHSLSKSVADIGAPADIAMELSSIYAWTIDFYRLQPNDQFEVLFEEELIDGDATGSCKILACSFTHNGRERKAYRYAFDGSTNYFDTEGESLRKAFLKAPVKYSRISSRYTGKRFHPVLKTYKAHLGTDYAAPHGTPIMAVGDGTVIEASYTSGNGNYVKIRHNGTYTTQYLHMSKRGVKKGAVVQQGDVIGYVGSTGLATGPHVCFRFWKNGQQVDHLKEDFPAADPIPEVERAKFAEIITRIDELMNAPAHELEIFAPDSLMLP